ncbi:DUF4362 domain-containing protein [Metabacillus sp. GX 13764]|uniref:DUF4362 domain-containing protein n=1 Tax=Metabacillus kandeliae TaxID=2900151 RepID=UPI001E5C99A3|nr:DUF4362 domain-containing protein [Metabacillus kandeliae]MCD7035242.1 DUF4362 domain-containing protein [Metabacillus kandeliae]
MKPILILCSLLLLAACSTKYSSDEAIKKGDVVLLVRKVENLDKFQDFLKNLSTKRKSKIRITAYTIEGDPIYTDLEYNGKDLLVSYDNTNDAYGGGVKETVQCSSLQEKKTDKETEYHVAGCREPFRGRSVILAVPN